LRDEGQQEELRLQRFRELLVFNRWANLKRLDLATPKFG
jgi:hypothetical protein